MNKQGLISKIVTSEVDQLKAQLVESQAMVEVEAIIDAWADSWTEAIEDAITALKKEDNKLEKLEADLVEAETAATATITAWINAVAKANAWASGWPSDKYWGDARAKAETRIETIKAEIAELRETKK